ncbi:MAG: type II CAAX endopeptidase family protein [Planctomycetota bacterium]
MLDPVTQGTPPFDVEEGRGFLLGCALVLTATGLVAAPLVAALVRSKLPQERVFFARWGFTHVGLVVLAGLVTVFVLGALASFGWIDVEGLFPALLGTACIMAVPAVLVGLYARKLHPEGLAALGWRLDRRAAFSVPVALFGYALLLPALFGVGILWSWLGPKLGIEFEPQPILVEAMHLADSHKLLALALIGGVVPLLEEWLFRGFLQPLLVQNLREPGGITLTSLIFASLHGSSAFLPIFCLALYLGWLQLQTHRLTASWAVHAAHNVLVLVLVWLVPDAIDLMGDS